MNIHNKIKIYIIDNKIYIEDIISRKYVYALDKSQIINIVDKAIINDVLPDSRTRIKNTAIEYQQDSLYKAQTGYVDGDLRHVDAYIYRMICHHDTDDVNAINFIYSTNDNNESINTNNIDLNTIDKLDNTLNLQDDNNKLIDKEKKTQVYNYISYVLVIITYDESDTTGISAETYCQFIGKTHADDINTSAADYIFDNICDLQCFE